MIKLGGLLDPLIQQLRARRLGYDILQMDETLLQVLKESGRAATGAAYLWVQRGGPPQQPIVLFSYDPSRVDRAWPRIGSKASWGICGATASRSMRRWPPRVPTFA